jgi:ribonuclease-3
LNENTDDFPESNEKLEFLGDALIGLVIAHELYQRRPNWSEGELTGARAALVRMETLARVASRLGLGKYIYMGVGEETGGGRERPTNLAAVLEALVGALLLDQGYEPAREFVLGAMVEEMKGIWEIPAPKDSKSVLQEFVQLQDLGMPIYRTVKTTGEHHSQTFTVEVMVSGEVVGIGAGVRKSKAEQQAAAEALKMLGS